MKESLSKLSKTVPIQYFNGNITSFCKSLHESSFSKSPIYVMRDFTPFANSRFEEIKSHGLKITQVDDLTMFAISDYTKTNKLAYFITQIDQLKHKDKSYHPDEEKLSMNIFHKSPINSDFSLTQPDSISKVKPSADNLAVHPDDLEKKILPNLAKLWAGYSDKSVRESLGTPAVSKLSAFLKFGMISVRQIYKTIQDTVGLTSSEKNDISRELLFRDFFYSLAHLDPKGVFQSPNWQSEKGKRPNFIFESDLVAWKKYHKEGDSVSEAEKKQIDNSKQIFDKWTSAKTEYPIINAGIKELTSTGYMLNRMRMLTTSYISRDNNIWWKYAEEFFARHLTDYDWTINSLNHQNIAKVGLYKKYTLDFSIQKQQNSMKEDRQKYYKKVKLA
jgi:deoxyribodipyrimidine photolyase